MAQRRFFLLERFQKDTELFLEYKIFINEYVSLGHANFVPPCPTNTLSEKKFIVPHLCVIREASTTTKLCVVCDASCKSSSGRSLNDITLKGFQVQSDMYDILCRFRIFTFVLTADIKKVYRQVKINPENNFLQNIVWRNSPQDLLQCIELQTVTCGTNFVPYAATGILNDIASKNTEFPLVSNALSTQTYVDDILSGFEQHKWYTISPELLETISQTHSSEFDMNLDNTSCKILGSKWNSLKSLCPNF